MSPTPTHAARAMQRSTLESTRNDRASLRLGKNYLLWRGHAPGAEAGESVLPLPLLLILALGFLLRYPGLTRFPLEQDELYTVLESTHLFRVDLEPGIEARPLYFLLQHLLFEVLPATPLGLRVVPFLLGMAGIWVTWKLGSVVFGPIAGVAAAALVATSPWHMYLSGMARYWSLVYLLAASAFLFLLLAYTQDRVRDWLLALLFILLGTSAHPTFLFPIAGAALGLSLVDDRRGIVFRWPTRRGWMFCWMPLAAALAAAFAALQLTNNETAIRNWAGRGFLSSLRLGPAIAEWLTPVVLTTGAIGAVVLLSTRTRIPARTWGAMAVLGFFSCLVLLTSASFFTDVYADYATASLPLVFVSAGALVQVGADRMATRFRARAAWTALAILLAGVAPSTVSHFTSGTRFDYRPAFDHIRRAAPDVTVLTWPLIVQRHYAPDLNGRPLSVVPSRLDRALADEQDLWLVVSVRRFGIVADDERRLEQWLGDHCRREMSHERPRFDYRQYRVDLHRCRFSAPTSG